MFLITTLQNVFPLLCLKVAELAYVLKTLCLVECEVDYCLQISLGSVNNEKLYASCNYFVV